MLNKQDLVNRLVEKGYTKRDANVVIDDITMVITETLASGESIRIVGFGTFGIKDIAERDVVNLHTGEHISVPAHRLPKFTAGKFLKRAVNEGFVRE